MDFSAGSSSDEIDAGIKFSYGERYLLEVSYIRLNSIGVSPSTGGVSIGVRIAF